MGAGDREFAELSAPLGRRLARMDVHLLTGGGAGTMAAVSRAFAAVPGRAGLVVGVLPFAEEGDARGRAASYPNPWVELPIRTHLDRSGAEPTSRNHVNVLTSDVVVALPGGPGTASEAALALEYGRPLVLLGDPGRAERLGARAVVAATVADAVEFVRRAVFPRRGERRP